MRIKKGGLALASRSFFGVFLFVVEGAFLLGF
jgi:hypothetical protein